MVSRLKVPSTDFPLCIFWTQASLLSLETVANYCGLDGSKGSKVQMQVFSQF